VDVTLERVIAGTSLFADLDPSERAQVAALMHPFEVGSGEVLFREGEIADRLHLIAHMVEAVHLVANEGWKRCPSTASIPSAGSGIIAMAAAARRSASTTFTTTPERWNSAGRPQPRPRRSWSASSRKRADHRAVRTEGGGRGRGRGPSARPGVRAAALVPATRGGAQRVAGGGPGALTLAATGACRTPRSTLFRRGPGASAPNREVHHDPSDIPTLRSEPPTQPAEAPPRELPQRRTGGSASP
jgi:hypothetical protein